MPRDALKLALIVAAAIALLPRSTSFSETRELDLLHRAWTAQWITCPGAPPRDFGVCHFRKTFTLATVPPHFIVHVSGDNQLWLFMNGRRVAVGPARGDLFHWRYQTLDLGPELRAGANTLAATVWNFGLLAPMAQMSNQTGFILQGNSVAEQAADTNPSWKCYSDSAWKIAPADPRRVRGYYVAGPEEHMDGALYPWGWQQTGFDDSAWPAAVSLGEGSPRGAQDSHSRWMLVPRDIPPMEMTPQRFARIVRSSGAGPNHGFLEGHSPVTIAPDSAATILLDQSVETTGYPEIVTSGGRASEVTLTYAEALFHGREKGNRNETAGKTIRGVEDTFLTDGGARRHFRPLQWRTWRYLQIKVQTGAEPLTLDDVRSVFTAYPLKLRAKFDSGDPLLQKMWQTGWRTARLCAHTTYMDCPYYERLQYGGDTRIQILISLYDSGDDRLARNAIQLLDDSRLPEGLTQSRYPSYLPQMIPPFSLYWIAMMHDLWWYRGEQDFLRPFLPGMRDVLGWFETRLEPSGLLGRLPWWNFADWTKDFADGVPPQLSTGQSSILSLEFARALELAADLESAYGSESEAARDHALAARITSAVRTKCWNASTQLLADTPARDHFSQHANILGVLTGAIPASEQRAAMEKVLSDASLTQCSYYFRFYLFQAMKKAGLGDEYLSRLGPWKHMLALGLTTWAETPEPTRSDCHAWSAHPNFDFLSTVAGIEPAAPGFSKVSVNPHLGSLSHLAASVPTPQGTIEVRYSVQAGNLTADITLPPSVSGTCHWHGKRSALRPGHQRVQM
jgi:alpha-L-rhamnosidase